MFGNIVSSNLITNGDFSWGTTGFASDYTYAAPVSQGSCYPEAKYSIVTSPNACHDLWADFSDPFTGTGNMMVVNGATTPGLVVWAEGPGTGNAGLGSLDTNTDYYFSAWIASSYPVSPAQLEFSVNGSIVGTFTASTTAGLWQQFYGTWNSGSNTSAELTIVDLNTEASGNDFALDDLSFGADGQAMPEPSNLIAVIGASLLLISATRSWSER